MAAALVLLFFGAVAGLMLGGLVASRPDHDRYVEGTRDAMAAGNTTVTDPILRVRLGRGIPLIPVHRLVR